MIDVLSLHLAKWIKRNSPESPHSVAVLKYAISFVLNTLFIISITILIAVFTGRVEEAATVLSGYAILRQVSGGVHLKSSVACILVSTCGATAISFADFSAFGVNLLNILALACVILWAPSNIEKQTRIDPKHFPLLKLLAIIIVGSNFALGSSVLALAFFVQGLTLIPGWERR